MADEIEKRKAALGLALKAIEKDKSKSFIKTAREIYLFMDCNDPVLDVSTTGPENVVVFNAVGDRRVAKD